MTTQSPTGFTLVEMMVVIAILAVVVSLAIYGLLGVKNIASRRALGADFYSVLNLARSRAISRQRTQVVLVDAVAGANRTFGFFHYEDAAQPSPNIFSADQLKTLATTMNPSDPTTAPPGISLAGLDSSSSSNNGFYLSADAWNGKPLPFPWSSLGNAAGALVTTGGCTFCSGGTGAIGFLPNGKVIFSDGNVIGGLVVMTGANAGSSVRINAVGVSAAGFVQQVEQQ